MLSKVFSKVSCSALLIVLVCVLAAPNNAHAAGELARIQGSNRVATAIAVSQRLFVTDDSAGAVIITRSDSYPDALSASSLAGFLKAPILLTPGGQPLSSSVRTEIDRVLAPNKPVIIVGGTSALPLSVDTSLEGSYGMERLAGSNRYDTARLIKERLDSAKGAASTSLILASGENFPDALSVSSYAAFSGTPIGLVKKSSIPAETKSMLSATVDSVFVIGGAAVVSDTVVAEVESSVQNISTRLAGADRYATAIKVAEFFFATPVAISVAVGTNFPDALAGSVLAGKTSLSASGTPVILTKSTSVPNTVADYLVRNAATVDNSTSGYVFGGTSVISQATEFSIEAAL
jgi:putative cell wall-binding protein